MNRWRRVLAVVGILVLGLAGVAWFVIPRFYSKNHTTSWTYTSPKYGFTMALPSSDWQETRKPGADIAFHDRKHSVLLAVNVVKGNRDVFQQSVRRMQEYIARSRPDFLSEPQFVEGLTNSGNPYASWTVSAKADKNEAVFVGFSLVWSREKDLSIKLTMEGPLTMRSKMGKSAETELYQDAVQSISLSVQ
jgi:hypothetical protein